MKTVFLDRKSISESLDLSGFEKFGEFVTYDLSTPEEIPGRVKDADIIVVNKAPINEKTVGIAENLKLVCVTATGTNNLDKDYLDSKGIEWRNVAGYSTDSVAQHTFAMLFYLLEHLPYYDEYVKSGKYAANPIFTHHGRPFNEIAGMKWGIIGLGTIGRKVAQIASAFGAEVRYYSTSGKNHTNDYKEVSFDELLLTSDIISIHAPLDDNTLHLIDAAALKKMKKSAILLNVGRGPIIVEEDLKNALDEGEIAAAGLDVLTEEPMSKDSPFLKVKYPERLLVTPHIAWASLEAEDRLMSSVLKQIEEFVH